MRSYKILSFSVVILLIAVAFAGTVTVPAAAQSGTIQNRYNAAHTGDYSPVTGAVPSNGQLLWNFTTNGSASTPIVTNGVVYVQMAITPSPPSTRPTGLSCGIRPLATARPICLPGRSLCSQSPMGWCTHGHIYTDVRGARNIWRYLLRP